MRDALLRACPQAFLVLPWVRWEGQFSGTAGCGARPLQAPGVQVWALETRALGPWSSDEKIVLSPPPTPSPSSPPLSIKGMSWYRALVSATHFYTLGLIWSSRHHHHPSRQDRLEGTHDCPSE